MRKFAVLILVLAVLCSAFQSVAVFASENDGNLARNASYQITTGEPITHSYSLFAKDGITYNKDEGFLNDGKTASPASENGWYRAYKGKSHIVTFDLSRVCAVSRVESGFLHSKEKGIYAPRYLNVSLSDDGNSFGTVVRHNTGFDISNTSNLRCDFSVELPSCYAARFVRIEFSCDNFVFCDEIKIIGSDELEGNEKKATPDKVYPSAGYLRSASDLKNIVKIKNGKTPLTEVELLPCIAYLDTENNVKGRMFDSLALLPAKPITNKEIALEYFNFLFSENGDLALVDATVQKAYSQLGLTQRLGVFIGVPCPEVTDAPFGDLDNNGIKDFSITLDERLKITKWYVDECVKEFNSKGYKNIYIAGFYWTNDKIDYSASSAETEFFKKASEHIKSKWLLSLMDFSYLSSGFDNWESFSFSGAVMRPNAAFSVSDEDYYFNPLMFEEFAKTAFTNRLGIGIETDNASSYNGDNYFEAGRNYERYLYYGYRKDYANALKTFSQGGEEGVFHKFCYSETTTPKGQYLRRLYDLTYSFINGLYKNEAPAVSVSDIRMVSGDSRITSLIQITDEDSYHGDLKIEFPNPPKNGSVAVSADKETLVYRADDGFVGEDSFTVRVNDGFNYSEEISVNVTVEPNSAQNHSQTISDPSDSEDVDRENGNPFLIIVIFSLVFVAFAIVVVIKIKTNKKR